MTYFEDLSSYVYEPSYGTSQTKNVGWLERGHEFAQMSPSERDLELLWSYCQLSIVQTRGVHECDLCEPHQIVVVERQGFKLLLGTSEIRVFSNDGIVYAAPSLIYHYVNFHHYKPPEEFLKALREGPPPPSQEYFEKLNEIDRNWCRKESYVDGKAFTLSPPP